MWQFSRRFNKPHLYVDENDSSCKYPFYMKLVLKLLSDSEKVFIAIVNLKNFCEMFSHRKKNNHRSG